MTEQKENKFFDSGDYRQFFVSNRIWIVNLLLLLLVLVSALGVIYSSYLSRQLFSELQQDQRKAVGLEENWGRLLIEQTTWASHSRIERLAKSDLKMKVPDPASIVVIRQ